MRRTPVLVALTAVASLLVGAFVSRVAFSEDPPAGAPPGMPSEAEMEKMMKEMAAPGEHHQWLAKQEGAWDVQMTTFNPDGSTEETKGSATIRMVLGGRFQEQTFTGAFHGQPYHGTGMTGYDNLKKEFQNYWFDTMGTAPSVARGGLSSDGKVLTLKGTFEMPIGPMDFSMVFTVKSADEFTFDMSGEMGGQAFPMMKTVYKRKPK